MNTKEKKELLEKAKKMEEIEMKEMKKKAGKKKTAIPSPREIIDYRNQKRLEKNQEIAKQRREYMTWMKAWHKVIEGQLIGGCMWHYVVVKIRTSISQRKFLQEELRSMGFKCSFYLTLPYEEEITITFPEGDEWPDKRGTNFSKDFSCAAIMKQRKKNIKKDVDDMRQMIVTSMKTWNIDEKQTLRFEIFRLRALSCSIVRERMVEELHEYEVEANDHFIAISMKPF